MPWTDSPLLLPTSSSSVRRYVHLGNKVPGGSIDKLRSVLLPAVPLSMVGPDCHPIELDPGGPGRDVRRHCCF